MKIERALGLLCATLALACGESADPDADSVTVGLLLPFTGTDSATASNFERAVLFARDEVNAGGGVGGHKLRVLSADTHSDPVRAEASARQLIDAGAWVLIGPESTEVAERVKPLLDEHDVLLLSPLVGAADERDVDCDNPWFRLAPSARVLGQALAKRMHADGHRHAAILSSEGAYDLALADAFESMLSTLDGETSYRGLLRRDAQSYAADVEGALDAGVDALLLSAAPRSAALAVNELGVLSRARPQLYLSPLLKTELLLQNVVPEVLDGAIGVTPRIVETSDEFPTAFARRWAGDQPLEGAYFYYDAMALVAFGLERAMQSSSHPGASALSAAILDESHGPGEAGRWNELRPLLPRLRQGEHIYYTGLTGAVLLRPCGDRQSGATSDWQVQAGAITDL